jgi:hypothetical protein
MDKMERMESKLKKYINITRCLSQHVGANTVCVFPNCYSCTDSNLCHQLCDSLNKDYKKALKIPVAKQITAIQLKSLLAGQI